MNPADLILPVDQRESRLNYWGIPGFLGKQHQSDCTATRQPFQTSWAGPWEVEDYVERVLRLAAPDGGYYGFHSFPGLPEEWAWGYSVRQIIKMGREGWKAGAALLKDRALTLANDIMRASTEESFVWDVTGAAVDVDTCLRGIPECMVDFHPQEQPQRHVTIRVNAAIGAQVTADALFYRGQAILGAINALEAMGVKVDLLLYSYGDSVCQKPGMKPGAKPVWLRAEHGYHEVYLHRPGWVLDPSRLSVWLAHPGWTRTVFYDMIALNDGRHTVTFHVGRTEKDQPGVINIPDLGEPWGNASFCNALIASLLGKAVVM